MPFVILIKVIKMVHKHNLDNTCSLQSRIIKGQPPFTAYFTSVNTVLRSLLNIKTCNVRSNYSFTSYGRTLSPIQILN